jgi:uncharacterized cupredoxin-like copper-binding protein
MRRVPSDLGGDDMGKRLAALVALSAALTGLVGCGDDDDSGTEGAIGVELSDFQIDLDESSAPAGEVTFAVDNKGPSVHEFVVFQTDLAPEDLPVDDNGDVAEDEEFAPVDEIEDIAVDATPELTVDLGAGSYVLICNIAGHYRQGMHTSFTVT